MCPCFLIVPLSSNTNDMSVGCQRHQHFGNLFFHSSKWLCPWSNHHLHAILYIKSTGVFVCLSVLAVSRHCPDLCFFVFLFFFYGFCFLCQLNCPDFCFFFFFLGWVLFSVLVKLPGPFFFFLMGFVFCVS